MPDSIPLTAPLPTASQFTLDGANPDQFEAFNVYVRQISVEGDDVAIYFPDLNGNTQAQPADLDQYLDSSGGRRRGATLDRANRLRHPAVPARGAEPALHGSVPESVRRRSPVEQVRISSSSTPTSIREASAWGTCSLATSDPDPQRPGHVPGRLRLHPIERFYPPRQRGHGSGHRHGHLALAGDRPQHR